MPLFCGRAELLAAIMALRWWQYYLEGASGGVAVVTNHKPNTCLDRKPAVQLSCHLIAWLCSPGRHHKPRCRPYSQSCNVTLISVQIVLHPAPELLTSIKGMVCTSIAKV